MILETVFQGPGIGTTEQYVLEIALILLGAFLLGYLFRHFLNDKYKAEARRLTNELILAQANDQTSELKEQHLIELQGKDERIDQLNAALSNAIADKVRLQHRLDQLNAETGPVVQSIGEPPIDLKPEAVAKPATSGPDDLSRIEGIGPKMALELNDLGYYSFLDLSQADPEAIRSRLKAKNPTFAVHDPTTWPEQAKLALDGEWQRLATWQKELKGGRRRT